ncbi:hypothetical protein AAKU55_004675 [Oxalobacteraceae bacterium GrIS 1.11]
MQQVDIPVGITGAIDAGMRKFDDLFNHHGSILHPNCGGGNQSGPG